MNKHNFEIEINAPVDKVYRTMIEDQSYREIADTLGITEINARVKMNRIKTKLKSIINP